MEQDQILRTAYTVVDKILDNLSACDYVSEYGSKAVEGLKIYRPDMVLDIAQAFGFTGWELK